MGRRFLATLLACLLAGIPLLGRTAPLGVVTQSAGGHLSTAPASAGATIYDGDHLSTDAGGALRLRSGASLIYLPGQSGITLHGAANGAVAELTGGTLVFSTAQAAAMEIRALEASLRAASNAPTVAQISVAGPKELFVNARRGALEFSYRGESGRIPEGASYRILLDSQDPQGGPDAKPDSAPSPWANQQTKKPGKRRRTFEFIIIGATALVTARAIHEAVESPDRP